VGEPVLVGARRALAEQSIEQSNTTT